METGVALSLPYLNLIFVIYLRLLWHISGKCAQCGVKLTTMDVIDLDLPNFYYVEYHVSLDDDEVVRRALSFVGETRKYNLINCSCETVSSYCKSGSTVNAQADFAIKTAITIGAVGTAVLALFAFLKPSKRSKVKNSNRFKLSMTMK